MDDIDEKIIRRLGLDARRALADIGAAVGLSASAVNERIRRLVGSGAIRRFTVDADPQALGLPVLAYLWIALARDADEEAFRRLMAAHPAISECHHVTGGWSYLAKVRVGSLDALEALLAEIKRHGFLERSETVIALSSVTDGPFCPKEEVP